MCLTFRGAVPPGPPLRGRADAEGVWLGGRRGCVVGRWADAEGVWLGGGRTQRVCGWVDAEGVWLGGGRTQRVCGWVVGGRRGRMQRAEATDIYSF